jgi:hypothetical protein
VVFAEIRVGGPDAASGCLVPVEALTILALTAEVEDLAWYIKINWICPEKPIGCDPFGLRSSLRVGLPPDMELYIYCKWYRDSTSADSQHHVGQIGHNGILLLTYLLCC